MRVQTALSVQRHPVAVDRDLPRMDFVDVDFTPIDTAFTLDLLNSRDPAASFAYVVTPNVDHVVRLKHRSDLWPAYRGAWMTLCDSRILARLAHIAHMSLPVTPGSDLTARMFEDVIERSDAIAIVGGSAEQVERLRARYGLTNVKHHNPSMGFIHSSFEVASVVRFIIEARARYVFLAIGSPQQEIVAHRVARTGLGTGIGLCVGASLDFVTGQQSRAPALLQRLSLEWLYRLGSDPRRLWRRYLVEGPEIFGIANAWRRSHAPTATQHTA